MSGHSEQDVRNTLTALYNCYCEILQEQCETQLDLMPTRDFFVTEQLTESRICDVQKLLDEKDKRIFCIHAFWNLLGVAPDDSMLKGTENYRGSIECYQRDLVFTILASAQFRENNVRAVNIPWKGVQLYKWKAIVALKAVCSYLPHSIQEKAAEIYRSRKRV